MTRRTIRVGSIGPTRIESSSMSRMLYCRWPTGKGRTGKGREVGVERKLRLSVGIGGMW